MGRKYKVETKKKKTFIHRLLAIQFVPRPPHLENIEFDQLEVDHIDQVKTNNNVDNLRWVTRIENRSNRPTHGCITSWTDKTNGRTYYKAHYNISNGNLKQKSSKDKDVCEKWLEDIKKRFPRNNFEDNQKFFVDDVPKRELKMDAENVYQR